MFEKYLEQFDAVLAKTNEQQAAPETLAALEAIATKQADLAARRGKLEEQKATAKAALDPAGVQAANAQLIKLEIEEAQVLADHARAQEPHILNQSAIHQSVFMQVDALLQAMVNEFRALEKDYQATHARFIAKRDRLLRQRDQAHQVAQRWQENIAAADQQVNQARAKLEALLR